MTTPEVAAWAFGIIRDQMGADVGPERLTLETPIEDIGFDSLDHIEMIMAIEEEYDLYIEDSEPLKWVTIGDAVDYIMREKGW